MCSNIIIAAKINNFIPIITQTNKHQRPTTTIKQLLSVL